MNTKVNEGKLISGKEALIALANGEDVEWRHPERDWFKAPQCSMRTQDFFSGVYQFRLKPRTITINGIEVPAPFEPKNKEQCFYLDYLENYGFSELSFESNIDVHHRFIQYGAWRTEEEIKQVVAALRQVFGGSHDN